jgi:hypothetical protein
MTDHGRREAEPQTGPAGERGVMKINGKGRECPQWCGTDHQAPNGQWDSCRQDVPVIPWHRDTDLGYLARAVLPAFSEAPYVIAGGITEVVIANSADDAKNLAALIEGLADSTPARMRQFAAQIRVASELAFEAEAEAE